MKSFSESRLILVLAFIQLIHVLDFMMVMPLGPDFAIALDIPLAHIGIIGSSYTLAAAATGFVAALFLDRFDRKRAIVVALAGLSVATATGALAWNFASLIAARAIAGVFGGPLMSLAIAMIADHIPPERRGAAMGKVMGSFSIASIFGVPFGLEIAAYWGWRAPFIVLALIAALVCYMACRQLPAHGNILQTVPIKRQFAILGSCFKNTAALGAFGYTSLSMMAGFMIIPNISSHMQINLHYPREHLGMLYFFGGLVSFFGVIAIGKMADKMSVTLLSAVTTGLLIVTIAVGYVWYHNGVPAIVIFVCFMLAMSSRSVCAQTLSSQVPGPTERASFMSLLSAITQVASALSSLLAAHMLSQQADGYLHGIEQVGMVAIGISLAVPFLFYITENKLKNSNSVL